MPYIYKITNKVNQKIYIGKTSSTIQKRFQEHIQDSKRERYNKRPLYDAFEKYGIENFVIEEIEQVKNDEEACEREIYWINYYKSYIGFQDSNGYNATLGGDSKRLYDYQVLVKAYQELGTLKAVTQMYHCDPETIKKALKEYNIPLKANNKLNCKSIKRIDPKTKEEKIYASVTEAAEDFPEKPIETARKNISRALNHKTTGYGYKWEFLNK